MEIDTNIAFIAAQIVGLATFFLNAIGHTQMTTKKVYIYNGICNLLAVIQYSLLGAWSGALCCLLAIVRNIVFSRFKKKVPFYVLLLYIGVNIAVSLTVIRTPLDIIPILNTLIYAVALWTKDIKTIKVIGLFTCFSGVFYDVFSRAYASILNEVTVGVIETRCIYLLKKQRKHKKSKKRR